MKNSVHLEGVRCDGEGHRGCQAGCLIFWKEAWLKRVDSDLVSSENLRQAVTTSVNRKLCTVDSILAASQTTNSEGEKILLGLSGHGRNQIHFAP